MEPSPTEPGVYRGLNLQFRYPENWTLSEDSEDGQVHAVTVESPDHSFFAINRYPNHQDGAKLLSEAVAAMASEYENLEQEEGEITIAGSDFASHTVRFYYLDLLIACQFVAIPDQRDYLLLQFQAEDRDFDRLHLVFQAMAHSVVESLKVR